MISGEHTDKTLKSEALLNMLEDLEEEKKKARENEGKLKSILSAIEAVIYSFKPNTQVTFVSDKIKECGYSPEEFYNDNKMWLKMMHPDDREHQNKMFLRFLKSKKDRKLEREYRFICKNLKKDKWVRDILMKLSDKDGKLMFYGSLIDITERKQAEDVIKNTNKTLIQERSMFIGGPVVIFKWQNKKGWPVEYVSPNVKDIFGYPDKDWYTGKIDYESVILKEDLQRVGNEIKVSSKKRDKNFQHKPYRIRRKDKKTIWIDDFTTIIRDNTGKITHYLGYVIDITEQKKAKEKYKILYETSRDAIMTLAPPSWRFTEGNPATVKMFGCKDEKEFIGLGPWQLSPKMQPDGQTSEDKAKKMIMKAMKKGSNFFKWTHKRYKGKEFPATVLLTKVEIEKRKPFLQATVRDISKDTS